jgi:hypothetical protein
MATKPQSEIMRRNIILFGILLLLGAAAYFVYQRNSKGSLADNPLSDFAIADTASVSKIIITDQQGSKATLERIAGNRLWRLNDTYFAREDAVNLLLKTFNRIRIRGNVSDSMRGNMMKLLATSSKRVEIFMGGDEPAKIYYVGVATPDHTGTLMLLEIPGIGRSEEPYITHIEGFTGFLSTRFFTNELEWRYTGVFNYPNLEFDQVDVIHHTSLSESYRVGYNGENGIDFYTGYDQSNGSFSKQETKIDSMALRGFLLAMKKVHFESFNTQLKQEQTDSIRGAAPSYSIIVRELSGKFTKVDLYLKPPVKQVFDEQGNIMPYDLDYFWGKTEDGEIGMAQTYNFAPLVYPASLYLLK